MINAVKSYRLVPNADVLPPPHGSIALGSLLANPKNPERSLNKNNRVPIPPSSEPFPYKDNYKLTRGQCRQGQGGLWASFLQMIVGFGGDVQVKGDKDTTEIITCKRLETQAFQPDDAYIYQSLQDSNVQDYLEAGWFKKPVYMITGLKIARGVTAETSQGAEYGIEGKLGVDGTSAGVPVGAGPNGKWVSKTRETITFTGSSDFVWTYRLIMIRSLKNEGFTEKDYNKGALYDLDRGEEKDSVPKDLRGSWEISALDDHKDDSLGIAVHSTVDENGDICRLVFGEDE